MIMICIKGFLIVKVTKLVYGLALVSPVVFASNGMNMTGYSARTIALGGAGQAIANGNDAMMLNPATLALSKKPELSISATYRSADLNHQDNLGNDVDSDTNGAVIPGISYSHPVGNWVLGAGLFVQGGLGADYNGLKKPFSSEYSLKTSMSHIKITPTVAYKVNDNFNVGMTLNVSKVEASPEFSNESASIEVDGAEDISHSIKVGFQYQYDDLSIGGSYTSKTSLHLTGGALTLDSNRERDVNYNAQMSGLNWPQEASLGFAYQLSSSLLLTSDVTWIDWSDAVKEINIKMQDPNYSRLPDEKNVNVEMNWKDQYVFKIGAEYQLNPNWVVRVGYNYADSPIEDDYLRPQFPAISETHYSADIGYQKNSWKVDVSYEYVDSISRTNNSKDRNLNPFGPGSTQTLSQQAVALTLTKEF